MQLLGLGHDNGLELNKFVSTNFCMLPGTSIQNFSPLCPMHPHVAISSLLPSMLTLCVEVPNHTRAQILWPRQIQSVVIKAIETLFPWVQSTEHVVGLEKLMSSQEKSDQVIQVEFGSQSHQVAASTEAIAVGITNA